MPKWIIATLLILTSLAFMGCDDKQPTAPVNSGKPAAPSTQPEKFPSPVQ